MFFREQILINIAITTPGGNNTSGPIFIQALFIYTAAIVFSLAQLYFFSGFAKLTAFNSRLSLGYSDQAALNVPIIFALNEIKNVALGTT